MRFRCVAMNTMLVLMIAGGLGAAGYGALRDATAQPADSAAVADPAEAPQPPATAPEVEPDNSAPNPAAAVSAPEAASNGAETPAAEAPVVVDVEIDPVATGAQIISYIRAGKWFAAAIAILTFLIWLLRAVISTWVPWLKTRPGGYALASAASFVAVLSVARVAGADFSLMLLVDAAAAAVTTWLAAAGLHTTVKDKATS